MTGRLGKAGSMIPVQCPIFLLIEHACRENREPGEQMPVLYRITNKIC